MEEDSSVLEVTDSDANLVAMDSPDFSTTVSRRIFPLLPATLTCDC